MENKNFLEELANKLVSIAEDIKVIVVGKVNAIDDSKSIIQKEYDNIKNVRVEMEEIGFILDDFADDINEIVDTIDNTNEETDCYLDSMIGMIECGYIVDDDYNKCEEDCEEDYDCECEDCCECESPCNCEE